MEVVGAVAMCELSEHNLLTSSRQEIVHSVLKNVPVTDWCCACLFEHTTF